jgi:hypothetical protein
VSDTAHSRRNGIVVSPAATDDDAPTGRTRSPSETARSWVIYVLGGSYPENHPILTAPSLFTDTPTYEDMMLLSSLMGPARPPVATVDDIARAQGVYRLAAKADSTVLVAGSMEEAGFELDVAEQCRVCLYDYEAEQEVRQLHDCGHYFHLECIDQVRV